MKFLNPSHSAFLSELRHRVDHYFTSNRISRYANAAMVTKTLAMLVIFYVPYALIVSESIPVWMMAVGTVVMGVGMAGIGMNVMHDANHGAYSRHSIVNTLVGYTINLVGGNAFTWKLQHNLLHHTYTNIHTMDEDIDGNVLLRFSEQAPLLKTQRYQHWYAFGLYSLLTVNWAISKDFVQFYQYMKKGLQPHRRAAYGWEFVILVVTKALFFAYALVVPLVVLDLAWWQVIIGFLIMLCTTGFILSLIFQLAHVVEGVSQPAPNPEGNIESAWAVHQLQTTANFAPRNRVLSWYIGGLNYQIEHHLFYGICHVHYPALSRIVKKTAEEFQIPYVEFRTFRSAVGSHLRALKKLGRGEPLGRSLA